MGGPTWGPSGWAHVGPMWVGPRGTHVGPMWVGPRGAHVGGPKPTWAQAKKLGPQKNKKKIKFSKSKSVLPKMSARSGLVGKNPPGTVWAHLGQFFAWAGKIEKMQTFCLFSLVGPWTLFTRFGALAAIHPRWGYWYFMILCQIGLGNRRHMALSCPKMSQFRVVWTHFG